MRSTARAIRVGVEPEVGIALAVLIPERFVSPVRRQREGIEPTGQLEHGEALGLGRLDDIVQPLLEPEPIRHQQVGGADPATCCGDGWKSCGSVPGGMITSTVAASPTMLDTTSPRIEVVAAIAIRSSAWCRPARSPRRGRREPNEAAEQGEAHSTRAEDSPTESRN